MPHPVALAGFSTDPERYEAGRPEYPDEAVSMLLDMIGDGDLVIDVGAGTGKLTRSLVRAPATVVAVDPVPAMLRVAARFSPTAHLVASAAERLPFATASASMVTAAQAFHWFDAEQAWAEFARVLRPRGAVALVWNVRLREARWVDDIWRVMDRIEKTAPWRHHDQPEQFDAHPAFFGVTRHSFRHTVPMDEGLVLARVMSVSHVAILSLGEQADIAEEIAAIVERAERPLEITYRTDLMIRRRR